MINVVIPNEIKPEWEVYDRVIDLRKGDDIDVIQLVRYANSTNYEQVVLWPVTYEVISTMLMTTTPFMTFRINGSSNELLDKLSYISMYVMNESSKFGESVLNTIIEMNPTKSTCAMEMGRQSTLYKNGLDSIFQFRLKKPVDLDLKINRYKMDQNNES